MHQLTLFFWLLNESKLDLNVALFLCKFVDELIMITNGVASDMKICTISV